MAAPKQTKVPAQENEPRSSNFDQQMKHKYVRTAP
jgi:hypothetical protein